MLEQQEKRKEIKKDILNVLILPFMKLRQNEKEQFEKIKKSYQKLVRFIINKSEDKIVYTFEYGELPVKIWNGSGLQFNNSVTRKAIFNKDLILIIKQSPSVKHPLPTSPTFPIHTTHSIPLNTNHNPQKYPNTQPNIPQRLSIQLDQNQISTYIRKINSKCLIGHVYVDFKDVNYEWEEYIDGIDGSRKLMDLGRKSRKVNSVFLDVKDMPGKDYHEFNIEISTMHQSPNIEYVQSQDTKLLTQIIDQLYFFYEHSTKASSTTNQSNIIKLGQQKQKVKNKQQNRNHNNNHNNNNNTFSHPKPRYKSSIQDIFSLCKPKIKLKKEIKLKYITDYYQIMLV